MSKVKNIAIVGANPYNGNRGVGALAYSSLFIVDNLAKQISIPINIFIVIGGVNDRVTEELFKVANTEIRVKIMPKVNLYTLKGIIRCLLAPRILITYLKLDFIFDLSEGDSFSDIYGKSRFHQINASKRLFRLLHKKYIFFPQTIGPFENSKLRKQAIKSLENAELVLVRDLQSYEYVKKITKHSNVHELMDVAFYMPYTQKEFDKKYLHIGLNVSALLWHGGYQGNNQFGLNIDYQKIIKEIINYFIYMPNIKLHLVPHSVEINTSIDNDYEVATLIEENNKFNNLVLAPMFLDPVYAKNYISGLDFFIGSRMHACIAAFSSGVPVLPMAYSRKFNGLFQDTLEYEYVVDLVKDDQENILLKLNHSFSIRNDIKENIVNKINGVIPTRHKLMTKLLADLITA